MFQRIGGIVLLALLFLQNIGAARLDQAPQAKELCFQQETGWCIRDRFLEYWWSNGGLPVFGYPLSPPRNEINRETGKSYLTQWGAGRASNYILSLRPLMMCCWGDLATMGYNSAALIGTNNLVQMVSHPPIVEVLGQEA